MMLMTRRGFLALAVSMSSRATEVAVPVHVAIDTRAKIAPERLARVWGRLWGQAVRDFARGGIRIEATFGEGSVERPYGREPIVLGLERGALNVVVTNHIPMQWDRACSLCGVTTVYRGYHLCLIALDNAHPDEIPFIATNTCVHEMLHAMLFDIFDHDPGGVHGQLRELRVDWYATRLWLLHDGADVRRSAGAYARALAG